MTDEDRSILTELLGECWHEMIDTDGFCTCGNYHSVLLPIPNNRTFTCWQDTGDLKKRIVEMGEWESFALYCDDKWVFTQEGIKWMNADKGPPEFIPLTNWLMDEIRFPELVVGWAKERGKGCEK